ncbi:MAG: DUF4136 domain-containing protein [Cyclobacteriaceae bacterium]|nr:DUF4136 domain-containing protein [Cyclobacteriaceae bacterium]MDW8332159.1 DUF4136 domain-containing protein [Cyclobacteriaceae bacterium]
MRKQIGWFIITVFVLTGCRMEPDLGELVQDMVVQTRYDQESVSPTFNVFGTYDKFTMRIDTMGLVSTRYRDTLLVDGSGQDFVKSVTRRVRDKFLEAGYTRVTPQQNPDFAVNVILLDNFSFFQAVNYAPFYSWYWGYYGYWFPYVTTYSASYGTLVIEVVDIKNYAANGNRYKVIWKAFIGDIYASIDRNSKTLEAVNQAFAQSPYIQKD